MQHQRNKQFVSHNHDLKSDKKRKWDEQMDLTTKDKEQMISTIKNRKYTEAFNIVTDSNWWDDNNITYNVERENFVYQVYFAYYNLLTIEGVKGVNGVDVWEHLRSLKTQLDQELLKIKNGIYESNVTSS